jgi:hypothetical protein
MHLQRAVVLRLLLQDLQEVDHTTGGQVHPLIDAMEPNFIQVREVFGLIANGTVHYEIKFNIRMQFEKKKPKTLAYFFFFQIVKGKMWLG